ncbi:MAG: branched-chain amino acid ABC transporter substrate-binding protein, partial [Betaproteobacteria bacterium]|nr:branched-chain amino acid ABC transporter substrate-binding protein [Betaproteobacteria bacterium]
DMRKNNRRELLLGGAAIAASAGLPSLALAQNPKEVKIAVCVPLSGAWARSGELHLKGAQLAVEDINAAGGIKALGGAKVKLIVVDAGDSTEKSKNAAQRMLSQDPDLVGGTGAFNGNYGNH